MKMVMGCWFGVRVRCGGKVVRWW